MDEILKGRCLWQLLDHHQCSSGLLVAWPEPSYQVLWGGTSEWSTGGWSRPLPINTEYVLERVACAGTESRLIVLS